MTVNLADKILKNIRSIKNGSVVAGILENAPRPPEGDLTMAQLMAIHEFGVVERNPRSGGETIIIPERSVIRRPMDERRDKMGRMSERIVASIAEGKLSARGAFSRMGNYMRNVIVKEFGSDNLTENSQWTIARKGSSKPLIDTGLLRNSVDYRVEE